MKVVDFAYEVISMHNELCRLRADNEELLEYRDKYMELLNHSIAHEQHMIGGLLSLALKQAQP